MSIRPIFALRQSPDWPALAAERAAGLAVAPERYVPAHPVPAFPDGIVDAIALWDAHFAVDFFACRAELRAIARATLDAVEGGVVLTGPKLPVALPDALSDGDFRLFFLDDDDWFAPDTAARMAPAGDADVTVFPLLRLDVPVFTFVRRVAPTSPVIGPYSRFSNRYQTNNYGLHPRVCTPELLDQLADHITASTVADRLGLRDDYCDAMLSVTNKSPVSASIVARIAADVVAFRAHVAAFTARLTTLTLPPHAAWMREPVALTAALFARALGA